jgi:UDP-glucose 4-epimerase
VSGRYLVTGGAGFIGSHLCAALLRQGRAVTVLDDFSTGTPANLAGLQGDLRTVAGSVADPAAVERAIAGARGVFHLAALPSVARSLERPMESHTANATGTVCVLQAAARVKARVVYAGSSSAYGDQALHPKGEHLREEPLSPYAASKLAGELYCRAFSRVYGLPVVVTRFFNVFGPRQPADSPYSGVVAAFCLGLVRGTRLRIDGDGMQTRDFTYVDDVVEGTLAAMDADSAGCEVVNLAYGESRSVQDLLTALARIAGREAEPEHGPPRRGDVRHSLADVTRARALLGFEPRVGFAEGLRRTFAWYRREFA